MFLKSLRVALLLLGILHTTNVAAGPPSGIQTRPRAETEANREPGYSRPRAQAISLWQPSLAATVGAGACFWRRGSRYEDDETTMPIFNRETGVGPGGWLAASVGGKLSPRWTVGLTLTVGAFGFRYRFTNKQHTELASGGPELGFEPMRNGVFGYARPEVAWIGHLAIMASVGGGYSWLVSKETSLGLGVQLSALYVRAGEEADYGGVYRYRDHFLAPSLVLRVASH